MAVIGGFTYNDSGALAITERGTAIPDSVPRVSGWAIALDGGAYIFDATTAALPTGYQMRNGRAFSPDGALCITTAAPASTAQRSAGFTIRADGAVHIDDSAPSKAQIVARVAGQSFSATGAMYVVGVHSGSDILLEDGSFLLQEDGISTFLLEV